jgi:pimeloyl-ACP methyl ester carboxylesterase
MHASGTYTNDKDAAAFARLFRHDVATVNNGVRIHYVTGGDGPALVLLHGFPEHWREWRLIMPALAESGYAVVAPDLRGFGDSDKPFDGYDALNVATDIHQLVRHLGHERIGVVGHDVGASIAYTLAAAYPDEVRGLVLMEAFPAGLEVASGRQTWHLGFMGTPDLPETLLAGRESAFIAYLLRRSPLDPTLFSDDEVDAYVRPFAGLGGVRGAAAHIRALPTSAAQNCKLAENKLPMPVLTIGAQNTFGGSIEEAATHFAENVTGVVAQQCGHWIPEERPSWLAEQLLAFFAAHELPHPDLSGDVNSGPQLQVGGRPRARA